MHTQESKFKFYNKYLIHDFKHPIPELETIFDPNPTDEGNKGQVGQSFRIHGSLMW